MLGNVKYGATTSERNKILENMRQRMMRMLTDTDGEATANDVEIVNRNGSEHVAEATGDT